MKREFCGLFGIYNNPEAAHMTYLGLYAQQHRGQESAGIVTWDAGKQFIREQKGMGLVADVFNERHLQKELKGDIAVGHVRYSTTGASLIRNAQPFLVSFGDLQLAIAHNGNLSNSAVLRAELEHAGTIFQTTMDTEIIVHLIARHMSKDGMEIEDAVAAACRRVEGAFSLLILANDKLIALKDPNGFRPLAFGRMGESYVFASETCAFDLLEAEFLRPVEPGEMVIIDREGLRSKRYCEPNGRSHCIFELIYFARPDSDVFGQNVYQCRKAMGAALARECPVDADFVMPFPDSGNYASVGYAQESGLPLELCMIRNHYVGRTFIKPSQGERDFSTNMKLNPVRSMVEGKSILVVEDSIVRGTTIRTRIKKLRDLGAREIHMRVSCPPIKYGCYYGIDFPTRSQLIAAQHSVDEIAKMIGIDSLHYLSIEGLLSSVQNPGDFCLACFDGKYPVAPCLGVDKECLEQIKGMKP
ncbi:amidophosphoribosyltransferase [Desulfovibrio ferrophilus]|uniref:Amidophosphoribosyltransferase n=1 Tax=Desulfovibrio ferrophilus TaxID=241368 RepID=A0A2Z6AV22_9BACT|nr:amidophosphoribosyltransferase [Desulfovibrio ferrophilus]BBD07068.1 amidophosphoribosyltransferase [Desulfovibrio ferrophilus]